MSLDVTTLIDFETSTDGTVMTDAIVANSLHGDDFNGWSTTDDPSAQTAGAVPNITIATSAARAISGVIKVNGVSYSSAGSRGMHVTTPSNNAIQVALSVGVNLSIGFFFRFNGAKINDSPRDVVGLRSDPTGNYQFLQIYDGNTPYFHAHWQPGGTGIGNNIDFQRDKWYWVTMKHVNGGQTFEVRFYDPDSNYSLLGTSTGAIGGISTVGCTVIQIGCIQYASGASQSFDFDNIVIDTNGAFPLLPSGETVAPVKIKGLTKIANTGRITFSV